MPPTDAPSDAPRAPAAGPARGAGLKPRCSSRPRLTVMSGATIAPGLPGMLDHYAALPDAELLTRLVLTVPALFIALGAPVAGWLADRVGRLRVLTGGALLYVAAGTSGLWIEAIWALLLGRAALGLAVACVMTAATALAGDYFEGPERGRFLGLQSACMGLGGLVYVTGGGFLADVHWRAPFAVYAAALLVVPMAGAFLAEPRGGRDGGGAAARFPGGVWAIYAVALLSMVSFYLVPVQLPFLLERDLGIAERSRAGIAIGVATLVSSGASLLYGRLLGGVALPWIVAAGFGLMAAAYALVAVAGSYGVVLAGLAMVGLGMGIMMPAFATGALSAAPEALRGRVTGGLTSAIFLGQFLSPILSQPLAGDGLQPVFGLFAAALAGAALLAGGLALARRPRSDPAPRARVGPAQETPVPFQAPGGGRASLASAPGLGAPGPRGYLRGQHPTPRKEALMALRIGDTAPDFTAQTTEGEIRFHDWIGDGYAILFSHPKDFTPVCTTELGQMAGMAEEFAPPRRQDHRHLGRPGGRSRPLEVRHPVLQRPPGRVPHDRRPRDEGRQALQHAARRGLGRARRSHARRQRDRAIGLHRGARQEGEAHPHLPDDDGPQLRRDPARARLDPPDGPPQGRDARGLAPGGGRHRDGGGVGRRGQRALRRLRAPAPLHPHDEAAGLRGTRGAG